MSNLKLGCNRCNYTWDVGEVEQPLLNCPICGGMFTHSEQTTKMTKSRVKEVYGIDIDERLKGEKDNG
jgi:rubrerythrin